MPMMLPFLSNLEQTIWTYFVALATLPLVAWAISFYNLVADYPINTAIKSVFNLHRRYTMRKMIKAINLKEGDEIVIPVKVKVKTNAEDAISISEMLDEKAAKNTQLRLVGFTVVSGPLASAEAKFVAAGNDVFRCVNAARTWKEWYYGMRFRRNRKNKKKANN